jgi:predicted RNA binding protein YcfA (HicA-like mRNA interferase family)
MAGWVIDRQRGSHVILIKPGNQLAYPYLSTVNWLRVRFVL